MHEAMFHFLHEMLKRINPWLLIVLLPVVLAGVAIGDYGAPKHWQGKARERARMIGGTIAVTLLMIVMMVFRIDLR